MAHRSGAIVAIVGVAWVACGVPVLAKSASADRSQVQGLAGRIEAQLSVGGCGATAATDVAVIQGVIAGAGADPLVARGALHQVQGWKGICPAASLAVARVDLVVSQAIQGSDIAHSSGLGGGVPIGAPSSYVSAGGSDYRVK